MIKRFCKEYLKNKISRNINEMKKGRWVSPKQAIAVSYSQTISKNPQCRRWLSFKSIKSRKPSKKSRKPSKKQSKKSQ